MLLPPIWTVFKLCYRTVFDMEVYAYSYSYSVAPIDRLSVTPPVPSRMLPVAPETSHAACVAHGESSEFSHCGLPFSPRFLALVNRSPAVRFDRQLRVEGTASDYACPLHWTPTVGGLRISMAQLNSYSAIRFSTTPLALYHHYDYDYDHHCERSAQHGVQVTSSLRAF